MRAMVGIGVIIAHGQVHKQHELFPSADLWARIAISSTEGEQLIAKEHQTMLQHSGETWQCD